MRLLENKNLTMARAVARRVADAGGRTFFVGGCVRDALRGQSSKDIDIEVHGIAPNALADILDGLGERTSMGVSFGVFGLKHYELDIAMPRREAATGRGHKDFTVYVDPFLGTQKAAERRDFTINALMQDVLTGEVIDHFGGLRDLEQGVLRHVNDISFGEDPLRVLRAAQFAARLHFAVAKETIALCRSMDVSSLASERVMAELEKALLKSDKPAVFFDVLRKVNQLDVWFPEVAALIGVAQEPAYHPEGDAWTHTLLVLDAAAALREQAAEPLYFMLAALTHDLGKALTTKADATGRIRSLNHETAGLPLATALLSRLTHESKLQKYVLNMVTLHMRPNLLAGQKSGSRATARLFDEAVCPEDLLLLAKADRLGQGRPGDYGPTERFLQTRLAAYRQLMAAPCVKGVDLVAAGLTPGPDFGAALAYAHKLHVSGVDKESALKQTLAFVRAAQKK